MNDAELLQEYASGKSETVFRALVERHLPLVYSAALRQVGKPDLAEDVTQVVFIILARKAARLSSGTCLAGWLFRTTRYTAAKAVRSEQRRRRREQEAIQMQAAPHDDIWEQVAPRLDEALAQLGEIERNAVLLHYFQHKRLRDVGFALGLSEDAAEKRIARAIGKLRKLLLKRRVALPVTVIPGLLMARGAEVPPPLLEGSVAVTALGERALSTSAFSLLQAAFRESAWPKAGAALSKATAVGFVTCLVILAVHLWPGKAREDPSAFSFETRIVSRSRVSQARLFPRPALLTAVDVRAASPSSAPTGSPPLQPHPAMPPEAAPSTNLPAPQPPIPTVTPPAPQPAAKAGTDFGARPDAPGIVPPPATWPAIYQPVYAPAGSRYPITPRLQPVFYAMPNRRGVADQSVQPLMQPAFYAGSGPWMPVQKNLLQPRPQPKSTGPTKKQP